MDQRSISLNRDRLAPRLAELSRKLANPTPTNIAVVQAELDRLSRG